MAYHVIRIKSDHSATVFNSKYDLNNNRKGLESMADFFKRCATGHDEVEECYVNLGAAKATATLTFTDLPTANDTFSIANITFTAKASGATGNQWNAVTDVTTCAANLVTAVNANTTLSKFLTASSAAGVVTFTIDVAGDIGNAIELSESLDNATISGFVTEDTGDNGTLKDISKA